MDTPLHPAIVHIPIALALLMPLVATGVLVAWWRKWLPPRAWAIVFGLQLVLVGSGLVAMNTGEQDEEVVERVVAEDQIHDHEEAAEVFTYFAAGVLALAALALALRDDKLRFGVAVVTTLASLGTLGLGLRTGKAGGELVYVHGAAAAYQDATPAVAAPAVAAKGDDDDDDDD